MRVTDKKVPPALARAASSIVSCVDENFLPRLYFGLSALFPTKQHMKLFVLLLSCVACASGLLAAPRFSQQQLAARRVAASPVMGNQVERVVIELEQGEPIEKALRRFRKASNNVGHLRILRNRKTFENCTTRRSARRRSRPCASLALAAPRAAARPPASELD